MCFCFRTDRTLRYQENSIGCTEQAGTAAIHSQPEAIARLHREKINILMLTGRVKIGDAIRIEEVRFRRK
jgi:hypothetical protein